MSGDDYRVVQERRAQQTGTVVQVIDNRNGEFDTGDPNGWFTLCVDHGGVCSHPTHFLARWHAPDPLGWCEGCMDAEAFAVKHGTGIGIEREVSR